MTNAEARFNNSLRPRKPEGSLRRKAHDGHLDSHTAPGLCGHTSAEACFLLWTIRSKHNRLKAQLFTSVDHKHDLTQA